MKFQVLLNKLTTKTMKKIEAIIKPFKLEEVKEALTEDRCSRHDC